VIIYLEMKRLWYWSRTRH